MYNSFSDNIRFTNVLRKSHGMEQIQLITNTAEEDFRPSMRDRRILTFSDVNARQNGKFRDLCGVCGIAKVGEVLCIMGPPGESTCTKVFFLTVDHCDLTAIHFSRNE